MTHTTKAAATSAQRGLLLAAHRAFRKHINTRCGQLKGESSQAGSDLNANPESQTARNRVHLALQQMSDLKEALTAFGPPASVPEGDFHQYICLKRNSLLTAYNEALLDVSRASLPLLLAENGSQEHMQGNIALARATGRDLACKEMLNRFDETFTAAWRPLAAI